MEPVYEVHGLCKYYGKKAALDGVDFTVEPGKLVGLLGPNGSGKTTLIKISAGLLTADSGTGRCLYQGHHQLPAGPHGPAYRVHRR